MLLAVDAPDPRNRGQVGNSGFYHAILDVLVVARVYALEVGEKAGLGHVLGPVQVIVNR